MTKTFTLLVLTLTFSVNHAFQFMSNWKIPTHNPYEDAAKDKFGDKSKFKIRIWVRCPCSMPLKQLSWLTHRSTYHCFKQSSLWLLALHQVWVARLHWLCFDLETTMSSARSESTYFEAAMDVMHRHSANSSCSFFLLIQSRQDGSRCGVRWL
jgi:hypothetical protein